MEWWEAIILGIIQGASEFLPISSSGHLLILEKLGVGEENLFFNIMLHIGTLVAVLICLRKEWINILKHPKQKLFLYIIIACVPTVAMGLLFKYLMPQLLTGSLLAFGFMLTAFLLFACEKLNFSNPKELDGKTSFLTGVFQGIAVLPGVSRSGSTISILHMFGVDKEKATSFSFLLSIPIILGSAILESASLIKDTASTQDAFFVINTTTAMNTVSFGGIELLPLILGIIFAFLSGLIAIKFFIKMIKSKSLLGFALYDALLALGVLVYLTVMAYS